MYAQDGVPIMSLLAEQGIRTLAQSQPKVMTNAQELDARMADACHAGA